jgi:predicted hotdog family 3-hydroxylacyl-ACP dehydratase
MLGRADIVRLIPHQGAMCLLDEVVSWDEAMIVCRTGSHLRADNPLLGPDGLSALCGVEYGMQAAALHGALVDPGRKPAYLAAIRGLLMPVEKPFSPFGGAISVFASREHADAAGMIYAFRIADAEDETLVAGRGVVAFRP